MELLEQILYCALKKELRQNDFSWQPYLKELLETTCYKALEKIKEAIDDDSLDDKECFMRIEKIICIFEEIGSDCGGRHDFG